MCDRSLEERDPDVDLLNTAGWGEWFEESNDEVRDKLDRLVIGNFYEAQLRPEHQFGSDLSNLDENDIITAYHGTTLEAGYQILLDKKIKNSPQYHGRTTQTTRARPLEAVYVTPCFETALGYAFHYKASKLRDILGLAAVFKLVVPAPWVDPHGLDVDSCGNRGRGKLWKNKETGAQKQYAYESGKFRATAIIFARTTPKGKL